jgi:flagellar biosynthetic protein FliR
MPNSHPIAPAVLWSFLLALARVSGMVTFLPLPGLRNTPGMTRIVLALALTLCLAPVWPTVTVTNPGLLTLTTWVLAEATFGILLGLFVAVVIESFQLGAQVLGLQAGFSYASTIDPGSQADSTVLQIFAQLMATSLFFALGLHRHVVALLAKSFETMPLGSFAVRPGAAEAIIDFSGSLFSNGLRIAFPVVALLLLVDIALALLGRMQSQLQLLSIAFPAKMLVGVAFLAMTLWVMPTVIESAFRRSIEAAAQVIGR